MFKALTFKIEGVTEYVQHNVRLADPTDPIVAEIKAITSKKKKTAEDFKRLGELEFEGSLYLNGAGRPWIPSSSFYNVILEAAKLHKLGKHVGRGVMVKGAGFDLEYKGPKTLKGLIADESFWLVRMVTVNRSKVRRVRPKFDTWGCNFTLVFRDTELDQSGVVELVEHGGELIGIGDTRQIGGGRFNVVSFDAVA